LAQDYVRSGLPRAGMRPSAKKYRVDWSWRLDHYVCCDWRLAGNVNAPFPAALARRTADTGR